MLLRDVVEPCGVIVRDPLFLCEGLELANGCGIMVISSFIFIGLNEFWFPEEDMGRGVTCIWLARLLLLVLLLLGGTGRRSFFFAVILCAE
jgi:hypothetical protein